MMSTASPSTSADCQTATVHVALELAKARWLLAAQAPDQKHASRYALAGGDGDGLLAKLDELRQQAEGRLGRPVRVLLCYEAGYDGFWLYRLLSAHGIETQVVDGASLPTNRKGKSAKTDRIDAAAILRAVQGWDAGDRQACTMVSVPSAEQEDLRRFSRERARLVDERTGHLARIRGLLMQHGIRRFNPWRTDWREQLDRLKTGDGRRLPPCIKAEVARQCRRFWQVQEMLRELLGEERARRRAALAAGDWDGEAGQEVAQSGSVGAHETHAHPTHAGPAGDTPSREAQSRAQVIRQLTRLRGVGEIGAMTLADEVLHKRFNNRRELAGYVGLTPKPHSSGEKQTDQGLDSDGNRRARWVMVQLAWIWVRQQPDSPLAREFQAKAGGRGSRVRRSQIVAIARKLLIALWRYVSVGVVPENAVMAR